MDTKEEAIAKVRAIGEDVRSKPKYEGKPYADPALDAKNPQLNKPFGTSKGGVGNGGTGGTDLKGLSNPRNITYKTGGKIRGHGIESKGRTKGRFV
jgi:hypothetical protein